MDQAITLELIIKSTLLLCSPVGMAWLHRHLSASVRVTFTLTLFVTLLFLPFILAGSSRILVSLPLSAALPTSSEYAAVSNHANYWLQPATRATRPATASEATTDTLTDPSGSGPFSTAALVLHWLCGALALALLLRVCLDYRHCDRFLAALPDCSDQTTKAELAYLQDRLGLNKAISLKTQTLSASPLAFSPPP